MAYEGYLEPIAKDAAETNRFFKDRLALGMLLSVVCPADFARINLGDIRRLTENTFMGDTRVRQVNRHFRSRNNCSGCINDK